MHKFASNGYMDLKTDEERLNILRRTSHGNEPAKQKVVTFKKLDYVVTMTFTRDRNGEYLSGKCKINDVLADYAKQTGVSVNITSR